MDQPPKTQAVKVQRLSVDLPETGFGTVMFFNRFGIEAGDTHVLAHFGYVARSGDVLSSYTTALQKAFLDANKDDWLAYLGKIGEPPERSIDASWRPPIGQARRVGVTNAIRLARVGVDAELRCYAISIVSIVDKGRAASSNAKLQAQPQALLQCSLEQQQLFLLALVKYKEL